MKNKKFAKKGQWGPDALVGIVLLALISLGGVFGLNLFVEGISYDNLIRIMDSELDETCFFTMMPMIKDEYMRTGDNLTNTRYIEMMNYFNTSQEIAKHSRRFEERFEDFSEGLAKIDSDLDIDAPDTVWGILSTVEESERKFEEFYEDKLKQDGELKRIVLFCVYPIVYNPAIYEKPGMAQFIIAEEW